MAIVMVNAYAEAVARVTHYPSPILAIVNLAGRNRQNNRLVNLAGRNRQ
jgi:hypothetical protein